MIKTGMIIVYLHLIIILTIYLIKIDLSIMNIRMEYYKCSKMEIFQIR